MANMTATIAVAPANPYRTSAKSFYPPYPYGELRLGFLRFSFALTQDAKNQPCRQNRQAKEEKISQQRGIGTEIFDLKFGEPSKKAAILGCFPQKI